MEVSKANVKHNIKNQIVTNLSPLTPEMQRQLETEGYVVLDNLLSEAELQELRDFDRVHPLPDDMASSDASVTSLTSDLSYRQKLGGKFKKIVTPKLAKLIPRYRFVFSLWFRKKPNSKNNSVILHQDPSFTDELQYLSLGIWCSLNDVDIEKSCLCVVKGSHKLNLHRRSYFISHGFPYDQTVLSCMEDNYLTPIPLKAGQAILFDKRLFHGSPPNASNIERVAATCFSLLPQDAPLYFYYRESKKADQLEIYEVEDDFYDNYIWGEKPHGNGVKFIGTEDYTYDPITPEIIAEVLEPLHQETSTNNSLVTTQTPSSMPTTQHQKTQPTKTETEWYQDLQYIQEQAQKDNEQLQAHLEEVKTELQNTQSELQTSQTELAQSQSELKTSKTQLAKHNSDLQYTQTQLSQIQFQLQQTQTKLTQSQSQLQTTETELLQLKTYLQQTQGEEGLINYYRSRIASNPDDIELYHQVLTIKPDDGQIHLQLGNALVRQNRFDDAIASYQTALQFHPENFEIYLELAKTFEKQNQYEQAITSYRQAIELNPDNALAHRCLGDILAEIGQLPEATTSYRRALLLQSRT